MTRVCKGVGTPRAVFPDPIMMAAKICGGPGDANVLPKWSEFREMKNSYHLCERKEGWVGTTMSTGSREMGLHFTRGAPWMPA